MLGDFFGTACLQMMQDDGEQDGLEFFVCPGQLRKYTDTLIYGYDTSDMQSSANGKTQVTVPPWQPVGTAPVPSEGFPAYER